MWHNFKGVVVVVVVVVSLQLLLAATTLAMNTNSMTVVSSLLTATMTRTTRSRYLCSNIVSVLSRHTGNAFHRSFATTTTTTTSLPSDKRHRRSNLLFFKQRSSPSNHHHCLWSSSSSSDSGSSSSSTSTSTTNKKRPFNDEDDGDDDDSSFQELVSVYLFRQKKTWKRLSPVLEMASSTTTIDDDDDDDDTVAPGNEEKTRGTVADIGCDHGLLTVALAVSGTHSRVLGVDVSDQALTYGAIRLLHTLRHQTKKNDNDDEASAAAAAAFPPEIPIEFRLGNGLEALEAGEADIICIAGMGVNTMLRILDPTTYSTNKTQTLDTIGCRRLVLQATNSRPSNIVLLYDRLHTMGWTPREERIDYLSSRWYITTRFERRKEKAKANESRISNCLEVEGSAEDTANNPVLPGVPLLQQFSRDCESEDAVQQKHAFEDYRNHHNQWIRNDAKQRALSPDSQEMNPRDSRWLQHYSYNYRDDDVSSDGSTES